VVWKVFEGRNKVSRKEDFIEIICGNVKLIDEPRSKMIELENV
jgi:hypothetical protein